jgi:hypothetical protein
LNKKSEPLLPRGPIALAIVGSSHDWVTRYRPALESLSGRAQVRWVYNAVHDRAQSLAAELKADIAPSLQFLAEKPSVDAILISDVAWMGLPAYQLLCRAGKPIFVSNELIPTDLRKISELRRIADESACTVVPDLPLRFTPASHRLRELCATKLGPPIQVRIELASRSIGITDQNGPEVCDLFDWFDWCSYILARLPIKVKSLPQASSATSDGGSLVSIEYRTPGSEPTPFSAELLFPNAGRGPSSPICTVRCKQGEAVLHNDRHIIWKNGVASGDEHLVTERSETQSMLDQFLRRVVGALVPVPDLGDAARSLKLREAAHASLSSQTEIQIG